MSPSPGELTTAYAWPQLLERPTAGSTLVYLDLNHWIYLAQANTGHRRGETHRVLLDVARAMRADGSIVFPLSAQHYAEMSLIRDPRRRADVAAVMKELSDFSTLLSRVSVMQLEIEAAIDAAIGTTTQHLEPVPLLGRGIGHAFGRRGGLRLKTTDGSSIEDIRATYPGGPAAFDAFMADLERQFEHDMLAGPADEDISELLANGYKPRVAQERQEARAQQEREQAARLDSDPRWRRHRLRDVIGARYVIIELGDMLDAAFARRGIVLEDVWTDVDAARRFVDSMPSADVHVSLQVAAHRNPLTSWSSNDYFDIDALSLAVAYCDVVLTEKHRAHAVRTERCDRRLGTVVLSSPQTLVDHLSG
jgi:hypothetical protein